MDLLLSVHSGKTNLGLENSKDRVGIGVAEALMLVLKDIMKNPQILLYLDTMTPPGEP